MARDMKDVVLADGLPQVMVDALHEELVHLWSDLAAAYRYSEATPPEKSQSCEGLIGRIHMITALVGPVSSDHIELPFLLTGMYEQVHAAMGTTVTVPEATLVSAREYIASQDRMIAKVGHDGRERT